MSQCVRGSGVGRRGLLVQVAFLFWRLLPGHFEPVGASPASTGDPGRTGCVATPCGVFPQAEARPAAGARTARVYDFGLRRARRPSGEGFAALHLRAHAAQGPGLALLGSVQSDGRVLPFAGRHMVVLDSERDERPAWTLA